MHHFKHCNGFSINVEFVTFYYSKTTTKKKTCLQDYSMCDFVFTVIIPCCKMDSLNVLEIYINKIINNRIKL